MKLVYNIIENMESIINDMQEMISDFENDDDNSATRFNELIKEHNLEFLIDKCIIIDSLDRSDYYKELDQEEAQAEAKAQGR